MSILPRHTNNSSALRSHKDSNVYHSAIWLPSVAIVAVKKCSGLLQQLPLCQLLCHFVIALAAEIVLAALAVTCNVKSISWIAVVTHAYEQACYDREV